MAWWECFDGGTAVRTESFLFLLVHLARDLFIDLRPQISEDAVHNVGNAFGIGLGRCGGFLGSLLGAGGNRPCCLGFGLGLRTGSVFFGFLPRMLRRRGRVCSRLANAPPAGPRGGRVRCNFVVFRFPCACWGRSPAAEAAISASWPAGAGSTNAGSVSAGSAVTSLAKSGAVVSGFVPAVTKVSSRDASAANVRRRPGGFRFFVFLFFFLLFAPRFRSILTGGF